MGAGNFAGNFGSPTQLIIILVIVLILFGGKRLRSLGSDLGNAIKGFKNSMNTPEDTAKAEQEKIEAQKLEQQANTSATEAKVTDAKATEKTEHKQP
jgi:sec-independent protein translocase protein TatA